MNRRVFLSGLIVVGTLSIGILLYWKRYTSDGYYSLAVAEAYSLCKSVQEKEDCKVDRLQLHGHKSHDPWGNPYMCKIENNGFLIISFGKGGKPQNEVGSGRIVCKKQLNEIADDNILKCQCAIE